ncbi:hypothetical protein H5410_009711 [Solanum commersonii]|uniref:Uncharacterized protein n=1 Tax=Solanum commersonii TaxID=4109 RepID=A0A9J6AIN8_SOLCO|nr:hypothetical protein H5410_009711 [Solanum commersonii]
MALKCGWPVIEKTSKTTAAYVSQSGSRFDPTPFLFTAYSPFQYLKVGFLSLFCSPLFDLAW